MRNDHGHGGHGGHGSTDSISPDLLAQMGYETRDVSLDVLGKWLIFLWVFIAIMTGVAYVTYKILVPNYAEMEKSSPIPHVRALPPYPQVQADPHRDIMDFKQAEEAVVAGKAENGGKQIIPISQAIDTLATQQGISGVRGDSSRPASESFPGSGSYDAPVTVKADAPPTVADPSTVAPAAGEETK